MRRSLSVVLVTFSVMVASCTNSRRGGGGPTPTPSCTTVCSHIASICAGIDTSSCASDCPATTADQRSCAIAASVCSDIVACMGSSCSCDTGGGCQTGCACDPDCGSADPCAAYATCTSCTEQAGCGFCGARGCVSGNVSGPATGSCAPAWQWTTSECTAGCACDTGAGCQSGCACDPDCTASVIGTACSCPASSGVVSCSSSDTCTGGVYECLSLGTTSGLCVAPCSAATVEMPCSVGGLCSTVSYNSTTYYYCLPAG